MLETDNFLGLNIESYLNYDGKAFKIALNLFLPSKYRSLSLISHSPQNQLKMTKENWAGRAPTCKKSERNRRRNAKNYIIGY